MSNVLRYLSPRYHVSKVKEDFVLMKRAFMERKTWWPTETLEQVAEMFRAKLYSSFFLSGPFSVLALVLGHWTQVWTQNPWWGAGGTVLYTILITTLAYQVLWWMDNRRLYLAEHKNRFECLVEMQRDLLPVHFKGIKFGLMFLVIVAPINAAIIALGYKMVPNLVNVLPAGVILWIVDVILVQGTFVRIMGEFFDKYSHKLASRHCRLARPATAA